MQNQLQNRNDTFFTNVRSHLTGLYGKDIVAEKLNDSAWPRLEDEPSLFEYLNQDRRRVLTTANITYGRLENLREELRREKEKTKDLESIVQALQSSRSYRLGNRLIAPLASLRGLFSRKHR